MPHSIDELNLTGKRVLVRSDLNVPFNESGAIADDTRVRESLPTIRKIIADRGKAIVMSHLGRPKGERNEKYSLRPVAAKLSELLGQEVRLAPDCIGPEVEKMIGEMKEGDVVLLENLRFHKEEEANDPEFARKLASLCDIYINDAFGSAHRAHASTEGITKFVREKAAGYLMLNELKFLGDALKNPARPFVAIIGGAKISGKIDVIMELLGKCDTILIGGAMMFTFLKAEGKETGSSVVEIDRLDVARQVLDAAKARKVRLLIPTDVVLGHTFSNDTETKITSVDEIPQGWMGLDIGPDTERRFVDIIIDAKTVLWNGPMGVFEMEKFATGTKAVAEALVTATRLGAVTIVGGGDSASAIAQMDLTKEVSHVSTGGGASLEFLEGKPLPGVVALG